MKALAWVIIILYSISGFFAGLNILLNKETNRRVASLLALINEIAVVILSLSYLGYI